MRHRYYDLVVIGAGPAGLSAARTATRLGFRTLVLEASPTIDRPGSPSSWVILPIPGFASGSRRGDGSLYFPVLDLLIDKDLVLGIPQQQKFISPAGHEFESAFALRDDFPIAAVESAGLLRQMAGQVAESGAEIAYGQAVTGLMRDQSRIRGVTTANGEQIGADVVLSAEGVGGSIVDKCGLFGTPAGPKNWATVASAEFAAPTASSAEAGQVVTLGGRYTSARDAFGAVFLPGQGRASVSFTVFHEGEHPIPGELADVYLDQYVRADPRVRDLLGAARLLGRSSASWRLRGRPSQLVRAGFMGLGDAISPGGHLGVLPAIYMGRQAALIAAEAIEGGDTSAECLASYQQAFFGPLFNRLEAEGELMLRLTRLTDDELDRVCQALGRLNLATPSFGNWRTVAWETLAWMVRQYPLVLRDWDLLQRVLGKPEAPNVSRLEYDPVNPIGMESFDFGESLTSAQVGRGSLRSRGDM